MSIIFESCSHALAVPPKPATTPGRRERESEIEGYGTAPNPTRQPVLSFSLTLLPAAVEQDSKHRTWECQA